jgi:hypothetical protein
VRAMTSPPPGQLSFDFGLETALRTVPVAQARAISVGLVVRPRAEFIPFPLVRRRRLVAKLAALGPDGDEVLSALFSIDGGRPYEQLLVGARR